MEERFSKREMELMDMALAQAKAAAAKGEVPAGAIVADERGQVLGLGHNGVIALHDPTAHAEILALREAAAKVGNYRLTSSVLYSSLEPCPMCLMAAIHARVAGIVYGAPEPRWGAAGSLLNLAQWPGLNHKLWVKGGLRAQQARELIRSFFQDRRSSGREEKEGVF